MLLEPVLGLLLDGTTILLVDGATEELPKDATEDALELIRPLLVAVSTDD